MFCIHGNVWFSQTFDYFWNTFLSSGRFQLADIFCIEFRFSEPSYVKKSVTRISFEVLHKFRTTECCSTLHLHMYIVYFSLVYIQIQMFCISRLPLVHFTFHWSYTIATTNIRNMFAVSTSKIVDILLFNYKKAKSVLFDISLVLYTPLFLKRWYLCRLCVKVFCDG